MSRSNRLDIFPIIMMAVLCCVAAALPSQDAHSQSANWRVKLKPLAEGAQGGWVTAQFRSADPKKAIEAIHDYWTPERKRKAIDLTVKTVDALPSTMDKNPKARPREQGNPTTPSRPYSNPNPNQIPQGVGRLYFTLANVDYLCTAVVVYSSLGVQNPNIVLTAGHCTFDPSSGNWADNVMFAPAEEGETMPYGEWYVLSQNIVTQWWSNADTQYDFALLIMYKNNGKTIGGATQSQLQMNYSASMTVPDTTVWGYPEADEYHIHYCEGDTTSRNTSDGTYSSISCDMGHGSSGSPWTKGVYVNAVSSFILASDPDTLYAYPLGNTIWQMYQNFMSCNPPNYGSNTVPAGCPD